MNTRSPWPARANVMDALHAAGHTVIPIGITLEGRWLPQPDAWHRLSAEVRGELAPPEQDEDGWGSCRKGSRTSRCRRSTWSSPCCMDPTAKTGRCKGFWRWPICPTWGAGCWAAPSPWTRSWPGTLRPGRPAPDRLPGLRRQWRRNPDAVVDAVELALAYPVFVKPANLGSSVGISKARIATNWRLRSSWPPVSTASCWWRRPCRTPGRSR